MAGSSLRSTTRTATSVTMSQMAEQPEETEPKFIIAVDYGTTYTGVAWTVLNPREAPSLRRVYVVSSWPGARNESKVPSTFTYSRSNGVSNWGHGIGANAFVLRLTKLDLKTPKLGQALSNLEQMLSEAKLLAFDKGPGGRGRDIPHHLTRTSEDVMTEYLRNVLRETLKDIRNRNDLINQLQIPIDLVITHPAEWDYRAQNITFRAVTTAFEDAFTTVKPNMGSVRLATEPEACAQYLVREAQERGSRLDMGKGACFIVVDAGGGTVDLATYRIEEVSPRFRITKITEASGDQCGATRIDDYFLTKFLPKHLQPEDVHRLLSNGGAETGHLGRSHKILKEEEKLMLEPFQIIKHNFKGRPIGGGPEPLDDNLALHDSLGIADSDKIRDGHLIITCDDMMDMFRDCVEGTIDLIEKQMEQSTRRRPDAIFLSGGLSRNKYYQREIGILAERSNMAFKHGQDGSDSWTAVAKGAVLMGMGLDCEEPPIGIRCPTNIGVVVSAKYELHEHNGAYRYSDSFSKTQRAADCIHWVFRKDDLITPDGVHKSARIMRSFRPDHDRARTLTNKAGTVTIVTAGGDGDVPERLNLQQLMELRDISYKLHDMRYDLDTKDNTGFRGKSFAKSVSGTQDEESYQQVQMSVDISVEPAKAKVRLRVVTTNAAGEMVPKQNLDSLEVPIDGSIPSEGTTLYAS